MALRTPSYLVDLQLLLEKDQSNQEIDFSYSSRPSRAMCVINDRTISYKSNNHSMEDYGSFPHPSLMRQVAPSSLKVGCDFGRALMVLRKERPRARRVTHYPRFNFHFLEP